MRPRTRLLAAGLLAVAPLVGPIVAGELTSDGNPDAPAAVVLTFQDDRIDESSGLVVRGRRLFTVNDSGDGPYVYAVDMRTGRTTAVLTYDDEEPTDAEALASGPGGALWVGDIGDNRRSRDSVRVHRLHPAERSGTVPAATFGLAYPDGPHNAETLLVNPRTGRLFVVTKDYRGGVVYEAPADLRAGETHLLRRVAGVPGLVTDGTFLPGGDRVLLRTYGSAALYTYPGFRPLGEVDLPRQEQGEGIAVEGGSVYLSSEGQGSDVLAVGLHRLERGGARNGSETDRREAGPDGRASHREYDPRPWMGLGPAGLLLAAAGAGTGFVLLRAARRRSRRRR
jgi:hypothetical protein